MKFFRILRANFGEGILIEVMIKKEEAVVERKSIREEMRGET